MKLVFSLLVLLLLAFIYQASAFDVKSNVSGAADTRYINVVGENDIFELDANGDVMPSISGHVDIHFEEDVSGDIQPKDQDCFTQDASGDYQPVE